MKEIHEAQAVSRAQKLREQSGWIPAQAFKMRRAYFIAKVRMLNSRRQFGAAGRLDYVCAGLFDSFPKIVLFQDTGVFHQKAESKSMQEAMATDPSMIVDMLKKNLTGLIPQVSLRHWLRSTYAFPRYTLCLVGLTFLILMPINFLRT